MLSKTIDYKDTDGNDAQATAYFNLTKAECIELNIRNDLDAVGKSGDNNQIMDAFQRIMRLSYGIRTGEGKFIKINPQGIAYFNEFATTEAYSQLFMDLWTNPAYAAEFIKAILPADILPTEGDPGSQGNVPGGLANHPSMQGYKKPFEATREDEPISPPKTLENFDSRPAAQPPALADNLEYQEFLAFKAQRDAPPAPVSTTPEDPQIDSTPPREELI